MRVPTNLITGFLGAGKTTAIRTLLPQRPAGARWSIFVNEYGMVSLDQVLLENQAADVEVQELAGGCFCCTTSVPMGPLLAQFVRRTRPDRLLIEPSGAGHPARVIDTLRSGPFRDLIDLRATLCLVDPKDFDNPRVVNRSVFQDQIQMADVVVLNWLDKRDPELVERCRHWITSFDPPKVLVAETRFGALDPRWLDLDATLVRPPRFASGHEHDVPRVAPRRADPAPLDAVLSLPETPLPGRPLRRANQGQGQWACGWIFAANDVFRRDELLDTLGFLRPISRLKGIFHCADDWWLVNRVGEETSVALTAYRRDSRLEIIVDDEPRDWQAVEQRLRACLEKPEGNDECVSNA